MDFRKEAKASRDKKLHQLTVKAPDAKVDASGFKPYADPDMDKKTGKRPINPRAFKRGGKVAALDGVKAAKRGDRMGAKGRKAKQMGGDISAEDRAKLADMAGEAAKEKSTPPRAANVPLPPRRPAQKDEFRAKEDIQSPYKKGGRTKKMIGGDITAGGNPQIPSAKGQTSLLRKAVGLDYKKGGRAKKADGGGDKDYRHLSTNTTIGDIKSMNAAMKEALREKKDKQVNESLTSSGLKRGGRAKKMDGGPMLAGPVQTLMKRKTPLNNPAAKAPMVAPMRAKGGKVHDDEAMDKALIKKMVKPEARKCAGGRMKKASGGKTDYERALEDEGLEGNNDSLSHAIAEERAAEKKAYDTKHGVTELKKGGRTKRAAGGRSKGKSNINIVIAPQPAAQPGMPPMGMPPKPMMPPMAPPAPAGAPNGMPPGGAMPMAMPIPVAMGAGAAPAPAPQGAGVPGMPGMAPLPRKSGGRIKSFKDMTAGAGSGKGRLEKEDMAEYKRTARKAGGKIPMSAGAGSGPGRIEKIHAYGENPHGDAAPKPKKRSWTM